VVILVYFLPFWYIVSRKSGNPAAKIFLGEIKILIFSKLTPKIEIRFQCLCLKDDRQKNVFKEKMSADQGGRCYNFKIFSPKKGEIDSIYYIVMKKLIITLFFFQKNRNFFAENWSKFPENCDHNIDPRLGETSTFGTKLPKLFIESAAWARRFQ
jgi:hypothetical protein